MYGKFGSIPSAVISNIGANMYGKFW
jgi:hypothetical protein